MLPWCATFEKEEKGTFYFIFDLAWAVLIECPEQDEHRKVDSFITFSIAGTGVAMSSINETAFSLSSR